MDQALVSVIIVNWNSGSFLRGCLSSLTNQDYPNIEIIVSDNASNDGSQGIIEAEFPSVVLIQNRANMGFAEGCNIGIRASSGEYVATLNPDAEPRSEWISSLVKTANKNQDAGSLASKVVFMHDESRIDSVGDIVLPRGDPLPRGFYSPDLGQYEVTEEVFGTTAGTGFYRRRALDRVGLFDSALFTWLEDVDLSWRLRKRGWKCYYVPSAIVRHYHSYSVDERAPLKLYYLRRNKLHVILKNYPFALLIRYAGDIVSGELSCLAGAIRRGEVSPVLGQLAALRRFPQSLRARKRIPPDLVDSRALANWIERGRVEWVRSLGGRRLSEYLRDIQQRPLSGWQPAQSTN
jgi:GT2 family glycosyltransferase